MKENPIVEREKVIKNPGKVNACSISNAFSDEIFQHIIGRVSVLLSTRVNPMDKQKAQE